MNKEKGYDFISDRDFFATYFSAICGIAFFRYMSKAASSSGAVSWMVPIICIPPVLIIIYLMYKGIEINNFEEIDEVYKKSTGKYVGTVLLIMFAVSSLVTSSIKIKVIVDLTQIYFYKKTPENIIIFIFILLVQYIIRGDLKVIIRFNRIIGVIILIMTITIIVLLTRVSNFSNLLPLFDAGKKIKYLKSFKTGLSTIIGIEFIYIVIPHLKKKVGVFKKLVKISVISNITISILCIYVIAVLSRFQLDEYIYLMNATIRNISITSEVIERWDALFQIVLEVFEVAAAVNMLYFSMHIFRKIFGGIDIRIVASFLIPFVYILANFRRNVLENIFIYENIFETFQILIYILLPVIVIIGFNIRKMNGGRANEKNN